MNEAHEATTACFLSDGPADGMILFIATYRCVSKVIIYRLDGDEFERGRPKPVHLHRPAVYERDNAPEFPEAKHFHEGMDRVVRAYPVLRYRFSVCVDQGMASQMQKLIDDEKREDCV